MKVYDRRGIPTIINAAGSLTRLSGGAMHPEVASAMAEACRYSVDMTELQAHASRTIAGITGAEAGLVTAGAAAGLLLGTAACITGLRAAAMEQLPGTDGLRAEVIVPRPHRNGYDHAVRAAGATLVEVGLPDRGSGAGVRDTEPWEIAAAIGPKTAAVLYVASRDARPDLPAVADVAHAAGVPVIVDAAAELPPQSNLQRFIDDGADLVAFSGGKALGGPQGSGLLCGRRDLIMAAALQSLDMDVFEAHWTPPADFIDKSLLDGLPRQGIGRAAKVGKQEVIGLLAALERFIAEGDAARHGRWLEAITAIREAIADATDVDAAITGAEHIGDVPRLVLQLTPARADQLARSLVARTPAIHLGTGDYQAGVLTVDPMCLGDGDAGRVAAALNEELARLS